MEGDLLGRVGLWGGRKHRECRRTPAKQENSMRYREIQRRLPGTFDVNIRRNTGQEGWLSGREGGGERRPFKLSHGQRGFL